MADYSKGLALLQQLGGVDRPAVLDLFASVGAEDFGAAAVAVVYGGVYQRPGLSLPQRQLVTVAALAALGYAQAQLEFHVVAAGNVGCTRAEVDETIRLATGAPGQGGLDELTQRLVLLATHTATGGVAPELTDHLRALHDAGAERQAVETVLHLAVYAGFPAALNALGRVPQAR
jgi:4-carboxymuconolactone decarboxylase